jgi:hypothetical protein
MSPRPRRPRHGASRLWQCFVALQILGCLATGFVSALLPDDPSLPAGIYDGDDDDAAATPEPLDGAVALIVDTTGVSVSAPAPALLGVSVASVSLHRPLAVRLPLLRSPPV